MTTTSLLAKVRRLLQDTTSGNYHWTDEQLKADLQAGITALNKVRPETLYVRGEMTDGVTLPESASATVDIEDRFDDSIVNYAAYMAYADDCTDPVSKALADDFLSKFNTFSQL